MDKNCLSIERIEIEAFKKIRNLVVEPDRGANLFFGSFRSGKTSLCEFIQFILYGADSVAFARDNAENAIGRIWFSLGDHRYRIERKVISGVEDVSFSDPDTQLPIPFEKTPGEFLTGLDQDSFDLITYFKQARYETPVCKPKFSFLNKLSSFHEDTKTVYRDQMVLEEKIEKYKNKEKNGVLDRLEQKKEDLENLLTKRPEWEEEVTSCSAALSDLAVKLDENDKRCVLIKADMAGYADDLTLSRNKENAEDRIKSIQAKEKKLRLIHYDVTHKIGFLTEAELDEMKEDYNRMSLAVTSLAEARESLSQAQETLAFHQKLFTGNENLDHYGREKKRIGNFRAWRTAFRIIGILLMGAGASLYFLLRHFQYDLISCLAISLSTAFFGIALACVSTVFSGSIGKILEANGKKDLPDFHHFYETLVAHDKTTQVYREKLEAAAMECDRREQEKEEITQRISRKITDLGYGEEDGEILAICDQIIEANDTLYDLQRDIAEEKAAYQELLSADVQKETLTISPEFAGLQKELAFLSAQNESLYKKKALLSARLKEARDQLATDPEEAKEELTKVMDEIEKVGREYESLELSLSLAGARKNKFEAALKERLTRSINTKTAFALGEGESFLFDDKFELCFRDRNSVLPLISLGGGMISELGLLAFRLSLAELLGKTTLPMIFDDSFAMLSPEGAKSLYQVLCDTCSQFFIATASETLLDTCRDSAKIISL